MAAIGFSAVLLFTFELLAGRLVLPVFGGSPAVWTTSLCFFTTVLFLGYLYAHVVATRLTPRRARVVHLGIAVAAVVLALLAPTDIASLRNQALPEAINVLLALTLVAGGPAFLLAATTPLLSAWFAGRGRDPWWLYATSNAASFLGLLAYPLLIEPLVPLSSQRALFTVGLAVLTGLLVVVVGARGRAGAVRSPEVPAASAEPAPAIRRQAVWLLAAAIPAGLLSATTNFLQTDLLSAPLIWVGPLAIYLLSFVVAFSDRGRRLLPAIDRLVPTAATLLWVPFVHPGGWPVVPLLLLELGAFLVLASSIHGHLALDRPTQNHLTRFYLVLSAGGLVATAFVALVAPVAFSSVLEYPILIVAGLVMLAVLPRAAVRPTSASAIQRIGARVGPYAVIGGLLVALVARQDMSVALSVLRFVLLGSIVVLVGVTPRLLAGATVAVLGVAIVLSSASPLLRVRTFFGVVEVRAGPNVHFEVSGTTIHGVEFTDERRTEPTAYYVTHGPIGDTFADLAERTESAWVGVVGLGVGTIARYARPSDVFVFFEIDQAVIDIARDRRYFTNLADTPREPRVVLGDGRLALAGEAAGTFDLLLLDAFTSDSVPAHLLTREAMQTYARTLRPGGLLFFHLSNRYYDLTGAVATTARSIGLAAIGRTFVPSPEVAERLQAGATITVIAGAPADVARFAARGWTDVGDGPLLTDDYSNLLRTLRLSQL